MKKRIYFIISSFLTFLFSVLTFLQMDKIIESSIESAKQAYAPYPDLLEKILNVMENHGYTYFAIISCIAILISLIIFVYSLKEEHILKKKGFLIFLSILGVFMSSSLVVEGLFFLNVIVLILSKRKVEEDYPLKKEIPVLKYGIVGRKEIIHGIILMVVYFSQFVWVRWLPDFFDVRIIIQIGFDVIVLILAILFFFKELKDGVFSWKGNSKAYLQYIFSKYGIGLVIYFFVTALVMSLTKVSTFVNQQEVEALPLWYMIPAACVWAPIVEEIIFRGVIRRFIKKDSLFIVVSALIFGILHTYREDGIINILLMSLPYASLGAVFAYVYKRSNNITCNIFMHALHNTIGTILHLFI